MIPELHPATVELLRVLADHDEEGLAACYGIDRGHAEAGAPLDAAILAWFDAGAPDAPKTEAP